MGPRSEPAGNGGGFRPDIEGLRALAVLSVLLYHARIPGFGGGYIGVDVFFVLSGFLITRLIAAEVTGTGTLSLPGFWARRARRLLPASTAVLVATVVASAFLVDPLTRGFVGRSALAASAFGANLLFWTRGGYSQLTLPEPLLHFWSLAVEEQFYLFWPLLLAGLARLRGNFRRLVAVLALPIAAASLVASILITPGRQSFAFYWLPTRAWELLAGALLAIAAPSAMRAYPFVRAVLGWAGLMVIVLCALRFSDPKDGFPGALALVPVLATVAVIVGGVDTDAGPQRVLQLSPLQWVGKRSYAIYLWHFPFLVLAEAKWGSLGVGVRAFLLVLSVGVAAVSFRYLEDPVRRSPWLAVRPRRSLAVGAGLVAVGVAATAVLLATGSRIRLGDEVAAPTPVVEATTSEPAQPADSRTETTTASSEPFATDGSTTTTQAATGRNPEALERLAEANAAQLAEAVRTRVVPSNLTPSLSSVYSDKSVVYSDGCLLGNGETEPKDCAYGNLSSPTVVVLFGDSHAAQWFPAFESLATQQGWRLVLLAKKHCPAGDVEQPATGYTGQCSRWRTNVYERIAQLKPTVVVMSSLWYQGVSFAKYREGWERTFAAVKPHSQHVVYLADTPIRKTDVPSCIAAHPRSVNQCVVTRRSAINPTRLKADTAATKNQGVDHIFPDDWLCDPKRCAVIIGNVLLYRDQTHLTVAAAKYLTPYIDTMLQPYLGVD